MAGVACGAVWPYAHTTLWGESGSMRITLTSLSPCGAKAKACRVALPQRVQKTTSIPLYRNAAAQVCMHAHTYTAHDFSVAAAAGIPTLYCTAVLLY